MVLLSDGWTAHAHMKRRAALYHQKELALFAWYESLTNTKCRVMTSWGVSSSLMKVTHRARTAGAQYRVSNVMERNDKTCRSVPKYVILQLTKLIK